MKSSVVINSPEPAVFVKLAVIPLPIRHYFDHSYCQLVLNSPPSE